VESLNASSGIDQLLFAREKWMAGRTEFQSYFRLGGASLKFVPAGAGYEHFVILGMNFFFHFNLILQATSILSHAR
jgi:hypothetical protein